MALQASDVLSRLRRKLIEFDVGFIPDQELLPELGDEVRHLLEIVVGRVDNPAFTLPGDQFQNISVAVAAASYTLPTDFWRPRRIVLNYSTGEPRRVKLVPVNRAEEVPVNTPAGYIIGDQFHPLDGQAATRRWGWLNADSIDVDYIDEPTDPSALSDTLAAPDEARKYLAFRLVPFMLTRAKVDGDEITAFRGQIDAALNEFISIARAYPASEANI